MSSIMTSQEMRRLFGPTYAPDAKTNPRHRAFLRKGIELYPTQELLTVFAGQPTRLRLAMGSGTTSSQFGKIITSFIHNERLVSRQTDPPEVASQHALGAYRTAFDRRQSKPGTSISSPIVPLAGWAPVLIGARLPALVPVGSCLLPIDLTGDDQRLPNKRKRSATIDISNSEEERPCKKTKKATKIKFLGFIDLTK
ncbi:hypothetical protein DFH09DRAFT_1329881 [Mycena vulgaris]|nr:hypothetical protein DFH09DRAFT_1329881 [Mycena vulgaris]